VSGLEQDVRRLDVPVDHSLLVRVREGIGHFPGNLQGLFDRKRALPPQPVLQRLSFHVRHHVVQETVRFARVDQGEDARVGKTGHDLDLTQESRVAYRSRQLRVQDLQSHLAIVLQVHCQVHRRHPATADLSLDRVPVGQRTTQA